jgi:hypothetical protein
MRTFALRNGDLVLSGSKYGMVEGMARAQQQIGLALREPIGGDRFHPTWGSSLPSYIGGVQYVGVEADIRAEVIRVVRDFIINQNEAIRRRAAAGLAPTITAEEMVLDVRSVAVTRSADNVSVRITITTASSKQFTILTTPGKAQ